MKRQARLEDFPLRSFDKLRYGDTDRQGHVNNAVFATLLETGRVEMAYGGASPLMDAGCEFVIARLELDFIGEIAWPGRIDIGTRVKSIGRSSLTVEQALFQSDRLVAWADSVLVQLEQATRKSRPLSGEAISKLKPLLAATARVAEGPTAARAGTALSIRKATPDDRGALEALIAHSARALTLGAYTPRQVETGLRAAFGVDTQLIRDGTFLVAEANGRIVGCGGWSRRRTLFGGDAHAHRDAAELDPQRDAAKIRAFFIDPAHARQGIGRALLERCEAEARAAGFSRLELMAMLSGVDFYRVHGYSAGPPVQYELEPGLTIEFLPMSKVIG
ncbi:MAG TPA: GNAT family N-acetyltransferase [Burkholderiaceae bacterium]|jgi:acyl-CoA thioesterase FadM/GNAT superfamily N-acetyltransferase|nr:GNAT family N-acetyltransferase [Burkholderiaceae bacterium]